MKNKYGTLIEYDEKESNYYAAVSLVLYALVSLYSFLMNELGIFLIDKNLYRASVCSGLILSCLPMVVLMFAKCGAEKWFKHLIMICAFANALQSTALLSFYAAIETMLPLFVSLVYFDKKMQLRGAVLSIISALLFAVMCVPLGTVSLEFWENILYANNPADIAQGAQLFLMSAASDTPISDNLSSFLILYYGIPQGLLILSFAVIAAAVVLLRKRKRDMQIKQIEKVQDHVLYAMSDIVENRDAFTGGHVKRATDVVGILINNLEEVEEDRNPLYRDYVVKAAVTHDLGKIAVDDDVLRSTENLDEKDFEQIRMHPIKSAEIIRQVLGPIENKEFMQVAENLAKYHHEWYDGTGYPEGLKGDAIPLEARIMAIADAYDALVSQRSYREALSHDDAYDTIMKSMGSQFDPGLKAMFDRSFAQLVIYYTSK